jgi:hypothetical protein
MLESLLLGHLSGRGRGFDVKDLRLLKTLSRSDFEDRKTRSHLQEISQAQGCLLLAVQDGLLFPDMRREVLEELLTY